MAHPGKWMLPLTHILSTFFSFFMCVCGWGRVDSLEQDDNSFELSSFPYFSEAWFAENPANNEGILSKHLNVQGEGSILMTDESSVLAWLCQATQSCTWWPLPAAASPSLAQQSITRHPSTPNPSPAPVTPSLSLPVAESSHIGALSKPLHFQPEQSAYGRGNLVWLDLCLSVNNEDGGLLVVGGWTVELGCLGRSLSPLQVDTAFVCYAIFIFRTDNGTYLIGLY